MFDVLYLQINGKTDIPVGEESEPVLLNVTHGNPSHFCQGFPKNMTVAQLRSYISTVTHIPADQMMLTRLVAKGRVMFEVSSQKPLYASQYNNVSPFIHGTTENLHPDSV